MFVGIAMVVVGIALIVGIAHEGPRVLPVWFLPAGVIVLIVGALIQREPARYMLLVMAATLTIVQSGLPLWHRGVVWCVGGVAVMAIQTRYR